MNTSWTTELWKRPSDHEKNQAESKDEGEAFVPLETSAGDAPSSETEWPQNPEQGRLRWGFFLKGNVVILLCFKYNSGWRDEHENALLSCLTVFTFWNSINFWSTTETVWSTKGYDLLEGPLPRRVKSADKPATHGQPKQKAVPWGGDSCAPVSASVPRECCED